MALNLFGNPTYNGKFMGSNSAKPIAGECTANAYKRNLVEAKVSATSAALVAGEAVVATNNVTSESNAGKGLNPTTLLITKASATAGNAFAVMSSNAVLAEGDTFPQFVANQIIYIALIGSGSELYLPADTSVSNNEGSLYWDGAKLVKATEAPSGDAVIALPNALILSSVVDGIVPTIDATTGSVSGVDGSVVKVRI